MIPVRAARASLSLRQLGIYDARVANIHLGGDGARVEARGEGGCSHGPMGSEGVTALYSI